MRVFCNKLCVYTKILSLFICVSNWLRTPPLTEPEEKRPGLRADGEDDGNSRFSLTVGISIVAFSPEPVNGKHLRCGWGLLPQALNPGTAGDEGASDSEFSGSRSG